VRESAKKNSGKQQDLDWATWNPSRTGAQGPEAPELTSEHTGFTLR